MTGRAAGRGAIAPAATGDPRLSTPCSAGPPGPAPVLAPSSRFLVIRDGRESAKKCSVLPLRGLPGIEIRAWVRDAPVDAMGCALLHPDGAPLTSADRGRTILLLDASWQHVAPILRDLRGEFVLRSIPAGIGTAYPRRSKLFADPDGGLATVEALYAASAILGEAREDALARYRHAKDFLLLNATRLAELAPPARGA